MHHHQKPSNTLTVDLLIYHPDREEYIHTHSIPHHECNRFAIKPLKWLRYLGAITYGREGRLESGTDLDDLQEVNYDQAVEPRRYYFRSEGSPRMMEVDRAEDRVEENDNMSFDMTTHSGSLRDEVVARDRTCIITGINEEFCHGTYVMPHANGDEFIQRVSELRGDGEMISDIDDIRNAILLYGGLHIWWCKGGLALLKTPNFALSSADVGYITKRPPTQEQNRFILHQFVPQSCAIASQAPHNLDVRFPHQLDQWPPSFILDMWYASCAYNRWKAPETIDLMKTLFQDNSIPHTHDGQNLDTSDDADGSEPNANDGPESKPSKGKGKEVERGSRGLDLGMMSAVDVILGMWSRSGPTLEERKSLREKREEMERKKEEESKVRVQSWLEV